jgi:glycosyltransferase involved in cell wall biosynthesis
MVLKILICSHSFHPSVGGIETVSRLLAEEFTKAGATVTVVTETLGAGSYPYQVVRRPLWIELRDLGRQSDIIFQNNISLRTLLPLLLLRKPIVVTHQTWLTRVDGRIGWQDRLKRLFLPFCHNIAISRAIAEALPVGSTVLPNPFERDAFFPFRQTPKLKDIVFMGRLVSDKGCDLLLQAIALLQKDSLYPSVSIIGEGTERKQLEVMSVSLGVSRQVTFLGGMTADRGRQVAQHKIMVIPSRWSEPFGIVALEGIAAGCAIVASSQGGLAEAVGPCGLLYPNGNVAAMSALLRELLTDESRFIGLTAQSERHLEDFLPETVAQSYLHLFRKTMSRSES